MTKSELDLIKGIGPATKELLLKHFGSVEKIREAPAEELKNVAGSSKGSILAEYFSD